MGKGSPFPIFGKRIGIQVMIMLYLPVKQPGPTKQNMTCIHWDYITPKLILVVLANGE